MAQEGHLTVVGTGIRPGFQTTAEARHEIETAERLFYLVNEPVAAAWIRRLNGSAVSLADCYAPDKRRRDSYDEMVERILAAVRDGLGVCAAFYGHPGVFVRPSREAVRRARREGFRARLAPGVSAEDCLFADLEVDPAEFGCQSFETTDFLLHRRRFDPRSALVLWQVGVIGNEVFRAPRDYDLAGVAILADELGRFYPRRHEVVIYEAVELPLGEPRIERWTLLDLPRSKPTPRSTLFVPPLPTVGPDPVMAARLSRIRR